MFRLVDRPLSFRQRANDWIYKMLFLWSREPAPGPRAGPWFAWFATAVILWRCRRKITKTILAVSPLRFLKKRSALAVTSTKSSSTATLLKQNHQRQRHDNPILQRKHKNAVIRARVKRLCIGDGPHVTNSASVIQTSQQIHYRVTRSGKVYGKYPNKVVAVTNSSQGSQ